MDYSTCPLGEVPSRFLEVVLSIEQSTNRCQSSGATFPIEVCQMLAQVTTSVPSVSTMASMASALPQVYSKA